MLLLAGPGTTNRLLTHFRFGFNSCHKFLKHQVLFFGVQTSPKWLSPWIAE